MVSLFLLLWLVPGAFLQEDCSVNSCHPELGDLMVGRANRLSASSTCGLNGPQNYCILGYLEDEKKCFICDSRQSYHLYNQESHRIENVITTFDPERKTKWWQSENGVHEVTIQLDLEALFQFSHLVLTFKSFRPAAMLVERSKDYGQTWKVFRYFAEDCAFHFPWVSLGPAKRIDEVICDDRYSSLEPSTEGEVVLKALDPSFNIDDPYTPHIQEQITLTNLRVKFTRLITLGDTLLQRKKRSPQVKYYYALYEMVVRGSCFCHGHASMCMPVDEIRGDVFIEPGMIHGRCVCQHNTVGTNCERCQEFYNDAPWRPSSQTHPHVCRRCNCHGHSETCHFDMAQYQASGGVSGGVCDNCRHDRVGPHCELCRPYLYQDPRLSLDDPQGCIPCDCDATGSLENGLCDPVSGRCVCKENVGGERCDRCKFGFYGLSQEDPTGCQRCTCNFLGSVLTPYPCDQQTGQCVCQSLAVGPLCDECRPGYWGLGNTVYPCSPCNCDHGGAYSDTCSSVDGQCQCRPNMVNRRCSDPAPGYFLAGLDFYLYEAENATSLPLAPGSALQIVPRERTTDMPVTWTGPGFVRVLDGVGLRFTVDNLPESLDYQLVIRYEQEVRVTMAMKNNLKHKWKCTLALPGAARVAIMDTRVCLNAGARYYVDITFRKQSNFNPHSSSHILIDSMGLIPTIESVQDFCSQSEVDQFQRFRCFELDSEQRILPDVCEGLIRSLSARIHNGAMVCRCNLQGSHGPSCSKLGGRCDCKPNVIGRCCDSCAPLTYGFGPSGCAPCDCDPRGAIAELCDQVRGQCPCRREVGGRRCDQCLPGYFGFPLCRPCECNSLAELCDQHTGVCRDCRKHSTGDNCERCLDGYFGDPASREPCKPCLCPDTQSSGRFFARTCNRDSRSGSLTCDCLTGHTGARCDACAAGFYGQLTRPGDGCRVCVCNDNADLADPDACDSVTGECLRCRHNTHGAHCQNCKPGYYGNALSQDCRECSCDRRGTEVAQCPLGSRCFCDSLTGQCPCRSGVVGVLCDECADGFWNLQGGSGCQPCQCDPANSLSNHCDKVTGQCQCRAEFGGRRCDGCGENHFGNPDLQCVSCDCNMDGTDRPACDPFTGECLCRVGVMGIFCDECAPGYDQAFPACTPCHPCALLVANEVHDVHLDVQRMRTLVSRHSGQLKPEDGGRLRRMLEMQSKLDSLANLTGNSCLTCLDIYFDVYPEILEKIRKHHADFLTDQKQVKEAERALEDSMDTRQEIKNRLANCNSLEEMEQLENKVKALSVVNLNEKICGASSDDDCSKSECGGALCPDRFGERACGGPTCDGSVPISQNATEIAEQGTNKIFILMSNLLESKMKALVGLMSLLTGDMVAPGDIEKVAKAVLDIQLPGSPGDVRSLVQNIRGALDNFTKFDVDLKNLEDQTKVAHELRDKAMEVRLKPVC
uniref:Laminin, beta 2-like n=1 Tax=Esox lucius TaxID=8010 RepID=A0A6Q2YIL3_ESOLU